MSNILELKLIIAKKIISNVSKIFNQNQTKLARYDEMLDYINGDLYRLIFKVPSNIFFSGICSSFVVNDLNHLNQILNVLKQVVVESIEYCDIEAQFTDDDFKNLKFEESKSRYGEKYKLNSKKTYVGEFFE